MSRFGNRLRGSSAVSTWMRGGGAGVSRVQRGSIDIAAGVTSNTATLATAVDLTRARIVWLGMHDQSADTTPDKVACRIALTNATTVTATVNSTGAGTRTVKYEVIEYQPGVIRRVQRGTITTTGAVNGTDTISSVDTTKSTVDYLGFTTTYNGGTQIGLGLGSVVLTNATTVTFAGQGGIDRTAGYQVVEWN